MRGIGVLLAAAAAGNAAAGDPGVARVRPETLHAFARYVRMTEARLDDELRRRDAFLWCEQSAERKRAVAAGQVAAAPASGNGEIGVPGGLIHDWIGAVFIPGATLARTLALVKDYDRHRDIYKPEVVDSKLLHRNGEDYRVSLRLLKTKVITVVLNTEHEVRYAPVDAARWTSRSVSSRIVEVANPGKEPEREYMAGEDHGFLWRLNSYWRFEEKDGGVCVECRAISLTRDIPPAVRWLIEPIVRALPKESLVNTLRATRAALAPGIAVPNED